ncbi:19629_t:CDS:1, partial [Dentiscutata erythropus]
SLFITSFDNIDRPVALPISAFLIASSISSQDMGSSRELKIL